MLALPWIFSIIGQIYLFIWSIFFLQDVEVVLHFLPDYAIFLSIMAPICRVQFIPVVGMNNLIFE